MKQPFFQHMARAFVACLSLGTAAHADQVFQDDMIVTNSLCVGFDCVNGENFSFDTIRLKENNTRIHFNDTSNSAGFPSTDWRIIANDSSNGGKNYLAIEDATSNSIPFLVEGAAPANSLRVISNGNVGFGTSNPTVDLHVASGNTPTLRLEQNGSGGFASQTWDLAGNEAGFFLRDTSNNGTLVFRVIPGAPANSLYIASDGDIGIGTGAPANNVALDINRAGDAIIQLNNSVSGVNWQFKNQDDIFKITTPPGGALEQELTLDADGNLTLSGLLSIRGGVTAPGTDANQAQIFVDILDGDLKVLFPNGTTKTIVTND